MARELIFILGGARAGKSTLAEKLASQPQHVPLHKALRGEALESRTGEGGFLPEGPSNHVLFLATAEAKDQEMARRIAAHKSRRPSHWDTLEEPLDVVGALAPLVHRYDTVLIDCLTVWAANLLLKNGLSPNTEQEAADHVQRLLSLHESSSARWIIVSNEVGLGVVPSTVSGGVFRDVLGRVNQRVAARADRTYLVVAGLVLDLHALGARPLPEF